MRARAAVLGCAAAISLVLSGCAPGQIANRPTSPRTQDAVRRPSPSPSPSSLALANPRRAPSTPGAPRTAIRYAAECVASQLVLTTGPRVSEMSMQDTVDLVLSNDSGVGCYFDGYPGVSFVDGMGDQLLFDDEWTGDEMVTSAPPQPVEVGPGQAAYLRVNTVACSGPAVGRATDVRVIPPNDTDWLQVSLAGQVVITACDASDPGYVEHVSPVEPSIQATAAAP